MASAVSRPPSGPRMKRPPMPNVQTGMNGSRPAVAAQSPSTPSKRPPSATTPGAASTFNGIAGANNPRPPVRRASQRPTDAVLKASRPGKAGEGGMQAQRPPEPYVRTTEYILNKHAKKPPSLIVHLHPTHFRFDQQDGSWSYQSQMKVVLEHIKQQTIPDDMMDELFNAAITFYDDCLIVEVRDHRHAAATKERVSKDEQKENNQPFSMHKHSKFLVPSPYVPYPMPKQLSPDRSDSNGDGSSTDKAVGDDNSRKAAEKEGESKSGSSEERVFTTVLFPNKANLNTELLEYAKFGDKMSWLKSKKASLSQKPGSAASLPGAPPPKRQKFLSDVTRLQEVEGRVLAALAPPLYLDPVDDMEQAQELLDLLRDPRHNEEPPAPKSRKRTIAELAADEALAAEEQRFMLIMDERLQPSAAGTATADTDTGGATFEPRFERFKAIEDIRRQHQERQREEAEAKAHHQAEKERVLRERQAADMERLKQAQMRQQQQQQQQEAQQARARAAQLAQQTAHSTHSSQHAHAHSTTNASMGSNVQAFAPVSAHQGSPAMRTMTPGHAASSPLNAQPMIASRSGQGSIPMGVTNSRQGSGSPPRPGSAVQHGHPAMVPQQPPSRNGTPHLPGGTPRIQTSTPVIASVAGTPRMNQGSPAMTTVAGTPIPAQAAMGTNGQIGGRPMNPQTQAALFAQHQQQQQQQRQQMLIRQQQQAMARGQGSPPMMQQMSPSGHPMQQIRQPQQMRSANVPGEGYRQQYQNMANAQMPGHQGGAFMGMTGPQQAQQQQQVQQFGQPMQQAPNQMAPNGAQNNMQAVASKYAMNFFNQLKQQTLSTGQTMTPELQKSLQITAMGKAREYVKQQLLARRQQTQMQQSPMQQMQQQQQQQQQHQQQQMMNGMQNGGMMGMNGGMG